MLLQNSRSIIGISLIIALATFGLFYSTAYAGDADGAITDDTTFAFKQNNFENSKIAIEAGVNILVSGTTIFKENNGYLKKNIQLLKTG